MKIVRVKRGERLEFSCSVVKQAWKECKRIRNKLEFDKGSSNSFLYVAKEKEFIVGFLYAYLVSESGILTYHSTAMIDTIIVDPCYRNEGIGTSLLETFLDVCYNYNIKIIETELFHENEHMRSLYWKLNVRKFCYRMRIAFEEEMI